MTHLSVKTNNGAPTERRVVTPGKYRHLSQCSSAAGHFSVLAIDHRGNLLSSLNKHAPHPLTDAEFADFKRQIMQHLLPESTAVLTDPDYGFAAAINGTQGLIAPLEVTDYDLHPSHRATNFIDGWSIDKIKRSGGAGVKLLLYYHPQAKNAATQRELVARIVGDCARHDIPFFLEPITYSLDASKPLESADLRQVVVESAYTFSRMGIDVLKTEFPVSVETERNENVWAAALEELNAACTVPWTLLSAGVDYATFRRQAELACNAGASGVIVGRAIWAEAVALQGEAREQFLATTARERMRELMTICTASATSWRDKIASPDFAPGWYRQYEA